MYWDYNDIFFLPEALDKDVAPTLGFQSVNFDMDNFDITMFDLGGRKNIRSVWKNYFPEIYAAIYVVDASTADRMDEARETLREALEHPNMNGKPVLL